MLSSVSLFASANAGELSVSGTAKATYNILSGKTNVGKGLGVTNELNFTASGETDAGYTWSYSMELDPNAVSAGTGTAAAGAENDDTKLTLGTPYGTLGVFISEGGLDVEDAASQSVYARPADMGDPSATEDNYTIDSYNNVQYHTPADLLPFGTSFKIAYAPNIADTAAGSSGNNAGAVNTISATNTTGNNATEMQLKASPIDGLTVGASYFEFDGSGLAKSDQEAHSGAYYATYATGPVSVGYSRAHKSPYIADGTGMSTATTVEDYDQVNYSIAFAASDDLTVSYERETSEANKINKSSVEQESTAVQVAYTMGGMTLAISHGSHDNVGYTDGANQDQTLFAVTMAF